MHQDIGEVDFGGKGILIIANAFGHNRKILMDPLIEIFRTWGEWTQQPSQTPIDQGYNEFECESRDGLTIRGWSYNRIDKPQNGTLIWLHGIGGSATFCAPEWLYLIRERLELETKQFFAVGFTIPGMPMLPAWLARASNHMKNPRPGNGLWRLTGPATAAVATTACMSGKTSVPARTRSCVGALNDMVVNKQNTYHD